MLPFHSNTHLPLLPCPSCHWREKLKQFNPRFCFLFFFIFVVVLPLYLFPSSTSGHHSPFICPLAFLSSSHSPGHCMGQDRSHDTLWDQPPTPSVIHHIPQMTAAATHSHFHLCISRQRRCVALINQQAYFFKYTCWFILTRLPGYINQHKYSHESHGQFFSDTTELVLIVKPVFEKKNLKLYFNTCMFVLKKEQVFVYVSWSCC